MKACRGLRYAGCSRQPACRSIGSAEPSRLEMENGKDINFQFLTENSVDILCRVSVDLVMHYASPSCFLILGWLPAEMFELTTEERVFAEDLPLVMANIARLKLKDVSNSTATVR